MRVLAIDPGYGRLGVAVLDKTNTKESLVYSNCFETTKESPFEERFKLLGDEVKGLIKKFNPNILAIETLFFNKNQKTAMRVSEVRGGIISIALSKNLLVREFTPLQIKVAVAGHGRADKNQVTNMVKRLIDVGGKKRRDDEFDAIAVGLTCFASEALRSHL